MYFSFPADTKCSLWFYFFRKRKWCASRFLCWHTLCSLCLLEIIHRWLEGRRRLMNFESTRQEAVKRLNHFIDKEILNYNTKRNFDQGSIHKKRYFLWKSTESKTAQGQTFELFTSSQEQKIRQRKPDIHNRR